jgi:TPR repeat protein
MQGFARLYRASELRQTIRAKYHLDPIRQDQDEGENHQSSRIAEQPNRTQATQSSAAAADPNAKLSVKSLVSDGQPKTPVPDAETKSAVPVTSENKGQDRPPRKGIRLTTLLVFGSETPPDANEHVALSLSAEQGDPNAQYRLALYDSYQTRESPELMKWLRAAASQNHVKAQTALGICYHEGVFVSKDVNEGAAWYRRAADLGWKEAQYALGCAYYTGEGVQQDYAEAVKWYEKAAVQGHAGAQFELGRMCCAGEGVPQDYAKAVKWFVKAAEHGMTDAQMALGIMYRNGAEGVPQNYKEAVKWYTKAAERGDPYAQYSLGAIYDYGEGVPEDHKEAARWFTKLAEQNDVQVQAISDLSGVGGPTPLQEDRDKRLTKLAQKLRADAQAQLGYMYAHGRGVPQDYTEAVKWYTKAAEHGDPNAQSVLGDMYRQGKGVSEDNKEAVKWFTKAAEQENVAAQHNLGSLYRHGGKDLPQDYKEAVKWYTKAAGQGDVGAQVLLGEMYEDGEGVPKDDREAVRWWTKAAGQGDAGAQGLLGYMYSAGQGVPKDYKEALKWSTEAAEQGDANAQALLGRMYWQGQGVLEDYTEAYKWALLAGMNGYDAQSFKEALRKEMTPSQIDEAQRRAKDFLAKREQGSTEGSRDQAKVTSMATGFLITGDGYLLTACHAVEKTGRVEVLYQQRTYPANVIVRDEATDVAVLKIDGSGFPCLPLVSSAAVKTGDGVFTMGFPQVTLQGAEPKFTEGSISSLSGLGGSPRSFQISVPVQPGNSGGPLVSEKGEVIGLIVSRLDDVAALLATGSVPQTVNYAIKSSFVLPVLESISGLSERPAKPSQTRDRPTAIENTKKAIVLILAYSEASGSTGPQSR